MFEKCNDISVNLMFQTKHESANIGPDPANRRRWNDMQHSHLKYLEELRVDLRLNVYQSIVDTQIED